ncbi:MAG TPA: hypothetical protein VIY48_05970 [Candidatus Paceibacterota bacterium]
MKRATITVGQGFTKSGEPIKELEAKREAAFIEASLKFGGYTVAYVSGGWFNFQKELVQEPSMVMTIMGENTPAEFKSYAGFLKGLFDQEAVLVTVEWIEFAEFV